MRSIWKFQVQSRDRFTIGLPPGAKFLSVQIQNGVPQSWWLVDESREQEFRTFRVFGIGHEVPVDESLQYLGTFQLHDGSLVFHLFEERS